jgi:hypothetical protein
MQLNFLIHQLTVYCLPVKFLYHDQNSTWDMISSANEKKEFRSRRGPCIWLILVQKIQDQNKKVFQGTQE